MSVKIDVRACHIGAHLSGHEARWKGVPRVDALCPGKRRGYYLCEYFTSVIHPVRLSWRIQPIAREEAIPHVTLTCSVIEFFLQSKDFFTLEALSLSLSLSWDHISRAREDPSRRDVQTPIVEITREMESWSRGTHDVHPAPKRSGRSRVP